VSAVEDAGAAAPGKVMPLARAIRTFVEPGMAVHAVYAQARPNAALVQLVREFRGKSPGFTLITPGLVSTQVALVHAGLVDKVITAYAGENYPAPTPNPVVQRAVREGAVEIENWSLGTWVTRLQAAALGVPFLPVAALHGSGIAAEHARRSYAEVADPFGSDRPVGVIAALQPDISFVQGVAADPDGNVVSSAPFGEGAWGALAARRGVIACVERIVTSAELGGYATLVKIPSHAVRAVCPVPLGSHPYGLFNPGFRGVSSYVEDEAFMAALLTAAATKADFDRWMDEWVYGVPDHDCYVARLGAERVRTLRGAANADDWQLHRPGEDDLARPATGTERMAVAAARLIVQRVRAADLAMLLAGVGLANLASWLAADLLAEHGRRIRLLAELGMYDYQPRPGSPFVFSMANLQTCPSLMDVPTVLGALVVGRSGGCMGAVGAGEIDERGNIGSTWSRTGTYVVGSGGANDVATSAAELLVTVKNSRRRMVSSVGYVTSPGDRVRSVVTDLGVFQRAGSDEPFVLTRVHAATADTLAEAVERIRGSCEWDVTPARELAVEAEPSAAELARLRGYDPHREVLGAFS
jgi:acyl CoA:acetate/3-ketoacid CoA transferase alpha subunit/acyl CoA:acetate/3-ketoacid CoA transferase beta subunit